MSAAEAAAKPTLAIDVGPLFGAPRPSRSSAPTPARCRGCTWSRWTATRVPGTGAATGDVGLTAPTPEADRRCPTSARVPDPRGAGLIGDSHGVTQDGQQVGFIATDGNPGRGQAHVYRVTGNQNSALFGGYTVVVLGE